MRVIIDTNILIYREDYRILPEKLQEMLNLLMQSKAEVLLHPLSRDEINNDKNRERKEIIKSKIGSYPIIENPPSSKADTSYNAKIGFSDNVHDSVDNELLYCVYKNAVDFLVTEDRDIHRKAVIIGLSERVFAIEEFVIFLEKQILDVRVPSPPALQYIPVHNLDPNDPILNSLKEEYQGFDSWWSKISREGRKAWVYFEENGIIGAILICKKENGAVDCNPPLCSKERLKICTFKVSDVGHKIGELFIKLSIKLAIDNKIDELYLTHFTKTQDYLIDLITEFGFRKVAEKGSEDIYVKKMIPDREFSSPIEVSREFYPSFYDGTSVKKFVIPIKPRFHYRLFTDYVGRQVSLSEFLGHFIVEGNTIKKAYLCHSPTKRISTGDVLLFYRSVESKITTVGVTERVYDGIRNIDDVIKYVGKRSVYTLEEIKKMVQKPTKIIIFRQHFHFDRPVELTYLRKNNILKRQPQSILEITNDEYLKIKKFTGLNESFTVH